jgi:2-polyprenyl-6-methoxyphenol hydroxylase-like FAD-dependent oxidoreductase
MRIVCVGGGPGGLYLAILLRRWVPETEVTVFERNARGRTDGWGIVYWDDLLTRLESADPDSASKIRQASVRWAGQALVRQGREVRRNTAGGYGLGRRLLLEILAERAAELGAHLHFDTAIDTPSQLPDADLIVACDGVGSSLRKLHEDVFRPQIRVGRNKYIWLGVKQAFEPFTFAFVKTPAGPVWFHAYTYGDTSTCIVECAPETWAALGFDRMPPREAAAALSRIFARELGDHELMAGDSCWQSFRTVRNDTWVNGRTILLGDAAHTAHFAIGSGTKLALDDAIALASALRREPDIPTALSTYEQERRPAVARTQEDACASAAWFENISRFAGLPDEAFFSLLLQRRSRLLAHVPPPVFSLLYRAQQRAPFIRTLRRRAGGWLDLVRGAGSSSTARRRLERARRQA